jgi:hypothetical protein
MQRAREGEGGTEEDVRINSKHDTTPPKNTKKVVLLPRVYYVRA